MRIAVLSSTPASETEGSGTFVGLDGLIRGLTRRGHEVTFRPLGFRTGFHTFDRWRYNVGAVLRPPEGDLVVGVDLDGFLWARRRRRRDGTRVPFVAALKGIIADELRNERGWVRTLLGIQAGWERSNARRADRVVVPSRYSARVAEELYGVPPARIAVVPEPIDLDEWRRRFAAAGRRASSRPTVLSVARTYPRKRLDDLLRAAVLLRHRIPDVQVRIVGDGPESERLRRLHADLALGDTAVLLGEVSRAELSVEYVSADCFCLPTVQESFGLVFAEAMAAGLPIVACRASAVPEIVADGQTGLLVPPKRPGELATAMETVLMNHGLRKELADRARQRVEAYDVDRVAGAFLESVPS